MYIKKLIQIIIIIYRVHNNREAYFYLFDEYKRRKTMKNDRLDFSHDSVN